MQYDRIARIDGVRPFFTDKPCRLCVGSFPISHPFGPLSRDGGSFFALQQRRERTPFCHPERSEGSFCTPARWGMSCPAGRVTLPTAAKGERMRLHFSLDLSEKNGVARQKEIAFAGILICTLAWCFEFGKRTSQNELTQPPSPLPLTRA